MDLPTDNLDIRVVDGVAVLSFRRGCLKEAKEILLTLESLSRYVSSKDNLRILLDMSNVEYLSSAGLGHLVALLKNARAGVGEFKICSLQDAIRDLFEVMRLDTIFEIFTDPDEALASFQPVDEAVEKS